MHARVPPIRPVWSSVRASAPVCLGQRGSALIGCLVALGVGAGLFAAAVPGPQPAQDAVAALAPETDTHAEPRGTRITRKRTLPYPVAQVWPAAVRYLRVDRGFTIIDRDPETGYVVFAFKTASATDGEGALEVFELVDASGRPGVSVQISTDAGPAYLPNALLEGLSKKIREERGQPAPPPTPKEPPTSPKQPDAPDDHSPPQVPPALDPSELLIN